MANINTRISLRNDALSNWLTSTVLLQKGEVALARLSGELSDNYEVRIGVGDKTWSQLPGGGIIIPQENVTGLIEKLTNLSTAIENISADSKQYTDDKIAEISADWTGDASKTITSVLQENGVVALTATDIAIAASQVTDLSDVVGAYVPLSVASNSATSDNKLQTASEVSSIAENAATEAIAELDVDSIAVGAGKTLASLGEVDGKISAEAVDIQITKAQVTDLTSDLNQITSDIDALSSNKLDKTEFSDLSNEIGLSAATSSNKVVTLSDIADITGAMHFRGAVTPNEGETDLEALARMITDPESGDVAIITTTSKEYVYNGTNWIELGDEVLYATKAEVATISGQLTSDIADLTADVDYLSGQITSITSDYATKEELSEASVALSTDYQGKIDGLTADVKYLSDEITSITDTYATKDYVNSVSTALSTDYQGKIDGLADTLNTVSSDYLTSADKEELTGIISNVSSETLVSANAYTDEKVEEAAGDLEELSGKVETLSGNLDELSGKVGDISSDVGDLRTDLDTLSGNALTGVTLNGVDFDVAENVASLSIELISCGNASA